MNLGYEEDELKPYVEPSLDFKEQKRIGTFFYCSKLQTVNRMCPVLSLGLQIYWKYADNVPMISDALVSLGYNKQEIDDSLTQCKYDDVFATYLLLGRKTSDVSNQFDILSW